MSTYKSVLKIIRSSTNGRYDFSSYQSVLTGFYIMSSILLPLGNVALTCRLYLLNLAEVSRILVKNQQYFPKLRHVICYKVLFLEHTHGMYLYLKDVGLHITF